jgi:hypothetical protein
MKNKLTLIGIFCLALIAGAATSYYYTHQGTLTQGIGDSVTATASSTVLTLTTSSQRLVATSSKRVAFEVAVTNCTTGGSVYVNDALDAPSTTSKGPVVFASTTKTFSEYNTPGLSTNAIQGIVNTGTCTVVVTEWRKNF